jgi:O-acetyl-ADP-ribose deacetylase (regulator of RNase III)
MRTSLPEVSLNVVLTAVDTPLAEAWEQFCGDLDFVSVHHGSIFDVECDAVVSPANSYGFMDGGIDMLYSRHFGWDVQSRLQTVIRERHSGELLVGAAEIVETGSASIPYLIAAPTMRVPMVLRESVNPYLAARAVFLLIQDQVMPCGPAAGEPVSDVIKTVAFPGLGTGVGRITPQICAHQVRTAINAVLLRKMRYPSTWVEAEDAHLALYAQRFRDLQFDSE